ncbi:MAG: ATP-binding cassette domain-containing protein [Acidimicrobiales bacterium]
MLVLEGVSKSYGAIDALDDVSFTVHPGEIVAVVGENGAGKSTLVKCIAGAELPDRGSLRLNGSALGRNPRTVLRQGVSVVWQDLALCENLDVPANLFLGRERVNAVGLQRSAMHSAAVDVFRSLGVEVPDLSRPIQRLSGGQRQMVAIARATLDHPQVLVLDEPTAALGVLESRTVRDVIRSLGRQGVSIVLVSHQLDEVFELADTIVVLRHGRCIAALDRAETHPDDVVSLIAGADADSTASRQLRRLHSLSEQLADADATTVLPLTVSSLSDAMSCDRLAVFLADRSGPTASGPGPAFHLTAALNLPPTLERGLRAQVVADGASFVEQAARSEHITLVRDLGGRVGDVVARLAFQGGLAGGWAAPIVGQDGAMAVIVGFTPGPAGLQVEQQQLLELFSTMAGAAIDRGRLVESLRVNIQSLEGLQGVLEVFAVEENPGDSLAPALEALRLGLEADAAVLRVNDRGVPIADGADGGRPVPAELVSGETGDGGHHRRVEFEWSRGDGELEAWWRHGTDKVDDATSVLHGAANSFRLALERGLVREARQESSNLRASRALERNLTRRLGHELRTPLTAIKGFASTLMQSDVEWADADRRRFTELIEIESERLSRLVDALFDTASIESGTFLPNLAHCNLTVAAQRATQLIGADAVTLDLAPWLVVWGDGDRLEQVFINLINNARQHNPPGTSVRISAREHGPAPEHSDARSGRIEVTVSDDGDGLPADVLAFLNGRQGDLDPGRGLGVRLVRGFVIALAGTIRAESSPEGTAVVFDLPTEPPAGGAS